MRKPILFLLALFVLLILVACAAPEPTKAPTVAPAAPKPTDLPKATDAPKPTVAAPAPTTAPPADAPKRGGKLTMAIWQSPTTLNPLLGTQVVMNEVLIYVLDGMLRQQPDGSYSPNLVKEVPSVQNGGVSADGKTVTYKLREGVLWSDGTPFTCEDVKFTYQTIMTPGIGISSTTGYSDMESVECPNPTTVVVKYKNFYAAYLTRFGTLIPKSAGNPKDIKTWAYNRKPIGTGPFKVQEWVADDHITLVRNE
ncbi:MAG: ABC transporter substrate-binding protein, partial [Anaerolineales bacterium]|nr:ABC transporter substrate-binding protein [Anaerolineales bacterium]